MLPNEHAAPFRQQRHIPASLQDHFVFIGINSAIKQAGVCCLGPGEGGNVKQRPANSRGAFRLRDARKSCLHHSASQPATHTKTPLKRMRLKTGCLAGAGNEREPLGRVAALFWVSVCIRVVGWIVCFGGLF